MEVIKSSTYDSKRKRISYKQYKIIKQIVKMNKLDKLTSTSQIILAIPSMCNDKTTNVCTSIWYMTLEHVLVVSLPMIDRHG